MDRGEGRKIYHQGACEDLQYLSQTLREKQGTMALVKIDMVLYTMWKIFMSCQPSLCKCLRHWLNNHANGGRDGYQSKLYKENLTTKCKAENTIDKDATTEMRKTALDESCT